MAVTGRAARRSRRRPALVLALVVVAGLFLAGIDRDRTWEPDRPGSPGTGADGPPSASSLRVPLAWFYRPPAGASVPELAAAAERYVLTRGDEALRDALRARGERGPFLQYLRAEAVMDDSGLGYTWQNQVAYQDGDWDRLLADHPDWFLRDAAGDLLPVGRAGDQAETRFFLMDPASPGWRAFFVDRLWQLHDEGWDGVFLDNVELSLAKRVRAGAVPARYPTDEAWVAAVLDFVRHLETAYFEPTGRLLEANLVEAHEAAAPAYLTALPVLDGVMREGWLDEAELNWDGRVREAELAQQAGLHVVLSANGAREDEPEMLFRLGSFLLADQGRASFRYTAYDAYDELWLYDAYHLDLGPPAGPREQHGQTWLRRFARGTVTVDPAARRATIVRDD